QAVERIVGRCDAAGHHELYMIGALTHFFTNRASHLGHTVSDAHGKNHGVAAVASQAEIGAPSAVGMAAGWADRPPGNEQTGAGAQPLFRRFLEAPVRTPGVANAR